jgi:hypothetical protein
MKEQLKRDLNKTYLVLESEDSLYEETYEIQMMTQNSLQTMLPVRVLRVDASLQLYYDVSAKQNLETWTEREKFSRENICRLFETVEQMFLEIKNYLLDAESVLLDFRHIYVREGVFYFCYCPWIKKDVMLGLRELLEEILGKLDYHDTKGVELAYHFYQSACKGTLQIGNVLKEHCVQKEILEEPAFLREEPVRYGVPEEGERQETKENISGEKKSMGGFWGRILQFFLKKTNEEENNLEQEPVSVRAEVFENLFLEEQTEVTESYSGDTTLLEKVVHRMWRLQPLLPEYEPFYIREDCFIVGKKMEAVDGCIQRNTISRIHSRLWVREGRLFISDANSTNGTFVNGMAVHPGEEVEIFSGDRILFADVGYECYNSF